MMEWFNEWRERREFKKDLEIQMVEEEKRIDEKEAKKEQNKIKLNCRGTYSISIIELEEPVDRLIHLNTKIGRYDCRFVANIHLDVVIQIDRNDGLIGKQVSLKESTKYKYYPYQADAYENLQLDMITKIGKGDDSVFNHILKQRIKKALDDKLRDSELEEFKNSIANDKKFDINFVIETSKTDYIK